MRAPDGVPRVALVTHDLPAGGGCATVTAFLYRVLTASGRYTCDVFSLATSASDPWSVRVLAPRTWRHGPQVMDDRWHGIPFRHVGAVATELEFQRYRPRPRLDALLADFDLVQCVVGIAAWGRVAAHLREIPLALHVASRVDADRASRLQATRGARGLWLRSMTRLTARIEREVLAGAACVFAASRYTYDSLLPLMDRSRLLVGTVGVDTDLLQPAEGRRSGYLLSVGAFDDPRKNVRLLLAAYAHLCQRTAEPPQLVLAGRPPSSADLRYLQILGLEDCVRVLGYVSPETLRQVYRDAGLFVLSSDEEGLGIGLLEAMASGLPVVSTRCGGPETAIEEGETGLMVPVGDAAALGDALHRLVLDPELGYRMGKAGRARAEERFSIEVTGRVFLDRYAALLGT
jgi:glycosyltransferase involved in cell wall biosynthesis